MTASILQQLLNLHFAIIYSWQLSSSGKSLLGKKKSSIYFKYFTDLDFFYFYALVCTKKKWYGCKVLQYVHYSYYFVLNFT